TIGYREVRGMSCYIFVLEKSREMAGTPMSMTCISSQNSRFVICGWIASMEEK
ncbi:unnamed protein product, partial [Candidula unifasciata]